jgi:DNA polymerase-1
VKGKLFLVDGHNVLYRTFYGVPRLTAPDGTPTNVVLGFVRILLKILKEERPAAVAAVFDTPEPTERHLLFPEYKANRLAQPEELSLQVPVVREAIDALGVPRVEIPGAEADDVIATLAREGEEAGMEVVVVSSDKDLYQIVSPAVHVRDSLKEKEVDEETVRETFGVPPSLVADLLALSGDPSDNVPGVPGVGEKTAAKLLHEHGTLEGVLAGTASMKGAMKERIEGNRDLARLCLSLVTVNRRVPLPVSVADLKPRGMDEARLAGLFRRLGFRKLLDEVAPRAPTLFDAPVAGPPAHAAPRAVPDGAPVAVDSASALLGKAGKGAAVLALSARGDGDAGVAAEGESYLLPGAEVPALLRLCRIAGRRVLLTDAKALYRRFPELLKEEELPLEDLVVAGYLLAPDGGTPTLTQLLARHLPHGVSESEREGEAGRAALLLPLGKVLEERLAEEELLSIYRDVDLPLLPVLVKMEQAGIRIDPDAFRELSKELAGGVREIERKVAAAAGSDVNVNSPKQLASLLFERLGLPPVKKTKTGYSTDSDVLEQLAPLHEIPSLVLEYRTLAKIRSTYVDVLPNLASPADGRIHTTFHLTVAATGRLSSSDPNLQNIPIRTDLGRRIREGFVAEGGRRFVGADYSQVELRILAHMTGCPVLSRIFREGGDIHEETAREIFSVPAGEAVPPDLRRRAKVINFGILYGMSAFGLSRELSVPPKEAKEHIDRYFARFPAVSAWIEGVKRDAREKGYVSTLLGRRRYIRDIDSRNRVLREAAERVAVNAPLQGTAADVIKVAMVAVDRAFRKGGMASRLVLQVHDELLVEAPRAEAAEAARILKRCMEGAASLSVPLTVSVAEGGNWGEVH